MIASVHFQRFRALRSTRLALAPCNLVLGPNGSGKTSLIEAMVQLRGLARLSLAGEGTKVGVPARDPVRAGGSGPEITFDFLAPHEGLQVRISCVSDAVCNELEVTPAGAPGWPELRARLSRIRSFVLDHLAIGAGVEAAPLPAGTGEPVGLARDGRNLGAALASLRAHAPAAYAELSEDFRRIMPEYSDLELVLAPGGGVELGARLADEDKRIAGSSMSQGSLYLLALLAVAHHPNPPSVVCLEEVDRGIHPRLLREVRDLMYRLSHPESFGAKRPASQVIATTHSPYLLDLFRDHPDEVVISHKRGSQAHFARLSEREDLGELLQEGSLGDIWLSGILGGVPRDQ